MSKYEDLGQQLYPRFRLEFLELMENNEEAFEYLMNNELVNFNDKKTGTMDNSFCSVTFQEVKDELFENVFDSFVMLRINGTLASSDAKVMTDYSERFEMRCTKFSELFKKFTKTFENRNRYESLKEVLWHSLHLSPMTTKQRYGVEAKIVEKIYEDNKKISDRLLFLTQSKNFKKYTENKKQELLQKLSTKYDWKTIPEIV